VDYQPGVLLIGAGMFARYGFVPEFVQTPTIAGYGFGASVTEAGSPGA
jgi:hypothetical protein